MAVTFDAISSPPSQTANAVVGTSGFTTTGGLITVGAGATRALVVCINFSAPAPASVVVKWDTGGTDQTMTVIGSQTQATAGSAYLYGLVAPTSGNKNLKVTWTGANSDIVVGAVAWTGVDQTGGATTFPHFASATGVPGPITLAITSAAGNATVATQTTNGTPSLPTQTEIYLNTNPANESGAASRAAGAASVTHAWTLSGNNWVEVGTDILADAGVVVGNLAWVTA